MDKLYDSKFMKGLQHFGEKLAGNKVVSAISSGMMASMGVLLAGAFFQIIANLLTLTNLCTTDSFAYQFFITPYNMSMGLISVVIAFTVAYNYAKALNMKTVVNAINAMILFLMVAAPATTVTLADGTTTFTGLDTSSLGGVGLFAAFLIAIVSVRITYFFEKYHIVLKMPDMVPQFLQDSFSSLLPLAANILIWHGLNNIIIKFFGVTLPMAITNILAMPLQALTSVPGIIIMFIFATILWTFGIHGTLVILSVLMPVLLQVISQNAALVEAGKPAEFAPVLLFGVLACAGGTGNTLCLAIMGLRSKSEQLKAVSKAALVPGIFNINEPITFGFPVMYNPIMAIPYIINPAISALIVWGGYMIGFFKPAYVAIMSVMPIFVSEFLGSMAWQNLFIPVIGFVVSYLVYLPFFKVYERQLVEREQAAKAAEEANN